MGDNWETQKHMTNEGRHMPSPKQGRGMLSGMPKIKIRETSGHVVTKPNNEKINNFVEFTKQHNRPTNSGMTKRNDR